MGKFNYKSKLQDVFQNDEAARLIEEFYPGALQLPQLKLVEGLTLAMAMGFKFLVKEFTGRSEAEVEKLITDVFAIE